MFDFTQYDAKMKNRESQWDRERAIECQPIFSYLINVS